MATRKRSEPSGYWPLVGSDNQVVEGAEAAIGVDAGEEFVLTDKGGIVGGRKGGFKVALRARGSALGGGDGGRPVVALGWHPDVPDFRDRTTTRTSSRRRLAAAGMKLDRAWEARLPERHSNLQWCSPVEDQGQLGSCTAQAVVGLVEFMQRRAGIGHVDGSRLFVYKVARNLLGWTGDTGAFIRTVMKAVAAFGVPPEEYWPYDISKYEEEPTAFLYSFADNYKALKYTRIDATSLPRDAVLEEIKRVLASGLGVAFGFPVYASLSTAPDIPFPRANDVLRGGHAVLAVGYDNAHTLPDGTACPSLVIRNSWGTGWGVGGYGFLPYDYVTQRMARDFWTILKSEWIELDQFKQE